jgi:hypothetical protein
MIEDESGSVVVCDNINEGIELGWEAAARRGREYRSTRKGKHAYSAGASGYGLLLLFCRDQYDSCCILPLPTELYA